VTTWNYRRWATIDDPAHKSDLNQITGDWGCLKSFRYAKDARAAGAAREDADRVSGKLVAGTATHEALARALSNDDVRTRLLSGSWKVSATQIKTVFHEELDRAVAGREVVWYGSKDNPDKVYADRVAMITGALNHLHEHVAEVVAIEPGFIAPLGEYWLSGHLDLIYRPRHNPSGIAFGDWKTGQTKPSAIELDHSWEAGVYSAAMLTGIWIAREHVTQPAGTPNRYLVERELLEAELIRVAKVAEAGETLPAHAQRYDAHPDDIRYVHLADYPPYEKAGKKDVKRAEELEFWKLSEPGEVKFTKGMLRGPGWYQVRRTEHDIPRLEHLLKNVVGTVRMGRFFESMGDKCARCPWRSDCLTAGYEVRGDERRLLELSMRGVAINDDGLGESA